jgi:hypothetical protein
MVKPAAMSFSRSLSFFLEGFLGEGQATQLHIHSQPSRPQWNCCPKWLRSSDNNCPECLACPQLTLSSSPRSAVWAPTWLTSWWSSYPCGKWHELFYSTCYGLREFPDNCPPVILYFGGNIGNVSLRIEVPLDLHRFPSFLFLTILYICVLFEGSPSSNPIRKTGSVHPFPVYRGSSLRNTLYYDRGTAWVLWCMMFIDSLFSCCDGFSGFRIEIPGRHFQDQNIAMICSDNNEINETMLQIIQSLLNNQNVNSS